MAKRTCIHRNEFHLNDDEQYIILEENFKISKTKSKSAFLRKYGRNKGEDKSNMAITKIYDIKATIDKAIDYICDSEKTDE